MQSVVRSSLVGLLALASLTACGDKVNIVQPSSTTPPSVVHLVTVTPNSVPNLQVGGSVTLSASVDADAAVLDRTVTWASSDATVASVDATGKVTGVKAGTVTISAAAKADPTVKGAALVTVVPVSSTVPIVTISAILQNPTNVPANLTNAFGQLDVVLNVDPNGQALKTISATMKCGNDSITTSQTVSNIAVLDADEAAAPVTLSFNTAAFNSTTGAVTLHNGACSISATATTVANQSATNTQSLTLNNIDGVLINSAFAAITNAEGTTQPTTATDAGGLPWRSGSVTVSAVPVLYSGRTITSVSITLPGAQAATQTLTAPPYSQTWSGSSTSGTAPTVTGRTLISTTPTCTPGVGTPPSNGCEANNATPLPVTPTVVVLDANGNDLSLANNILNPGIGNASFRLDNTAPQPPTTFIIPQRQQGWVGSAYTFTGTGGSSFFPAPGTAFSTNYASTKYVACGDGPAIGTATNPPTCATQVGVSAGTVSGNTGVNGNTTFTFYSMPAVNYNAAINSIDAVAGNSPPIGTSRSVAACATTGWTKITSPADLAATLANNAYVVRVYEADKLLNERCTELAANPQTINSSTVPFLVGKFGVDKLAPTAVYVEPATDATAAADLSGLGFGGNIANFNVKLALSDDASGFSSTPVLTMVQRLAIDPLTNAAADINAASGFGCPSGLSQGSCTTNASPASVPGNYVGVLVSNGPFGSSTTSLTPPGPGPQPYVATPDASNCLGCGYFFYTETPLDLARNTAPVMTRKVVVDFQNPVVGGVAVPATITGGTSASFATSATDNLDLVSSNYTLSYPIVPNGSPVAAAFPIRANGPAIGVAFDNTLTTSASFSVAVPFFIRTMATTTAGDAPQNNAVLPGSITVRAFDAAGNSSASVPAVIAAANVPTTGQLNFVLAPPNANPAAVMSTFKVGNTAVNITNCPTTGCAANAPAVNPTSVTLTAAATGVEGVNFQFLNPFTQVQFYYLDTCVLPLVCSNEYILIGTAVAPTVTDNATVTARTFTWTLNTPFDPPAIIGPQAAGTITLKVIAVGVAANGDALASQVNVNVTMTNP